MTGRRLLTALRGATMLAGLLAATAACEPAPHHQRTADATSPERILALEIPAEHARGEVLFEASCAACHGARALGTIQGPPLVHIVYEPSHHADAALHHWQFGDMPPVPGVSREEVDEIVAYVRWLQRQAGIH